ncbi:unnamed protein product [Auanema sp. JU1783]|nr:unnamed protein product [Auanema sp. JU1783]
MKYKLCTLEYNNEFKSFSLGLRNNDITIGSGSSDYIEVTGIGIVPMHARLVYTYTGVYLIVLGNSGCSLESDRFLGPGTATLLTNPTNFSLGDVLFTYHEERASSRHNAQASGGAIQVVGQNPPMPPVVLGTQDNPITLGIDLPTPRTVRARSVETTTTTPVLAPAPLASNPFLFPTTPSTSSQNDSWFNKDIISCAICLDIMQNATSCVPCMHKFCHLCILRWIDTNKTCPRCRTDMTELVIDPDFSAICSDYVIAKGVIFASPAGPVPIGNALVRVTTRARRSTMLLPTLSRSTRPRARRRLGFQ